MAENTITDLKSARALVKYETGRQKVVYGEYIAANAVTLDNVSDHVKALQELAFPKFDAKTADDATKYARKSFGNRVRNGLNTHLGKVVPSKREETGVDGHPIDPETGEDIPSAPTATVEATPAQSLALALQAAQAAGMTRDEILAVVADVVAVAVAA